MKRRVFAILMVLLLVTSGAWAFSHRQYVKDQYVVYRNPLQAQTAALLPKLDLTSGGAFLYKASQPEVLDAANFNQACGGVHREHSIVLGCYTKQRFYVYNVTDARLQGVQEVTAAHELLHAVYERLSPDEKETLNQQLRTAAAAIQDERFVATLEQYKKTEPGQVDNELHSILGTEIAILPESLEAHYRHYFKDRSKIVTYAEHYADTFSEIDTKIKAYDDKLTQLKEQKESMEASLAAQQRSIESQRTRMDQLQSADNIEQYNQLVPGFNGLVRAFNDDVATLKDVIANYNLIVAQRNELAATQNDLLKQLDSSYQTIH
ncbi:MAG: hypothetical protein U0520_04460 [Candidatus Saccharimonadales bacterium]